LIHRQTGTNGGCHGFFDQVNLPRPCLLGRFNDRPLFHGSDPRRHRHHQPGADQLAGFQNLCQEILDHHAGDFKIGDDPVFERTNGYNPLPMAPDYIARFLADGDHLVGILVDCHHRRFVQDNTLPSEVDEGVGRTEVHGQISAKETQEAFKHIGLFFAAGSSAFHLYQAGLESIKDAGFGQLETGSLRPETRPI